MIARAWGAALACVVACAPNVDVVAYGPVDAGGAQDTGVTKDAVPEAPPSCAPLAASAIYLADKAATLTRFAPQTGAFETLGPPDCFGKTISATASIAVDPSGAIWMADISGAITIVDVSVTPPRCNPLPLALGDAGALPRIAFVRSPAGATLYAVASGALVAVDPHTLVRSPVAPFDGSSLLGLSGTVDGRLYALRPSGAPEASAAVTRVSPGDGSLGATVIASLKGASYFAGGAYWGGDFYLFGDGLWYVLRLATGDVLGPQKGPDPTNTIVAVAAAPCG